MKKLKLLTLVSIVSIFSCNKITQTPDCITERTIYKDKEITKEVIKEISIENKCVKKNLPMKVIKPFDIVSSNDGSYVYVISKNSNYKPYEYQKPEYGEYLNGSKIIERDSTNIIYKITKNNQISIIKNFDYLGCSISQIEKKQNGDLIILDDDNYIVYSFDENNYKIEFSKIGDRVYPSDLFLEGDNVYLSYQSIFKAGYGEDIEFIKEYNLKNNIFSYFYMDEFAIQKILINKNIKPKFVREYYSKSGAFPYPMISNINHLNKNLETGYSRKYSIYNETPFFEIKDLIKDENEIKKVGTVYLIRKNSKGEVFGVDMDKNVIWKILPNEQKITLFAGKEKAGYKDGKGEEAEFNGISEIDTDNNDNLYVADTGNNAIRKITPDGVVSTFYV